MLNLQIDKINSLQLGEFDYMAFKDMCLEYFINDVDDPVYNKAQVLDNLEDMVDSLEALPIVDRQIVINFLGDQDPEFAQLSQGDFVVLKNKVNEYRNNDIAVSTEFIDYAAYLSGALLVTLIKENANSINKLIRVIENRPKDPSKTMFQIPGSTSKMILPYKDAIAISDEFKKGFAALKALIEKPSPDNVNKFKLVFFSKNVNELIFSMNTGTDSLGKKLVKTLISAGISSVVALTGIYGIFIVLSIFGAPALLAGIVANFAGGVSGMWTMGKVMRITNKSDLSAETKGYTVQNVNGLCESWIKLSKELLAITPTEIEIKLENKSDIKLCKKGVRCYIRAMQSYGRMLARILSHTKQISGPTDGEFLS